MQPDLETQSVQAEDSFVDRLKSEFTNRRGKIRGYSLRRFAKSLAIDPSLLSKMFLGKRNTSPSFVRRMGISLGLDKKEIDFYLNSLNHTDAVKSRTRKPTTRPKFQKLPMKQFSEIASWEHFAILSLAQLASFSMAPEAIAEHLRIEVKAAAEAISHLVQRGLLVRLPGGSVAYPTNQSTVAYTLSNEVLVRLQKAYLLGAMNAMDRVSIEERDQSGVTMAISKKDIGQAKQKIKNFRRELMQFMESADEKDEVYHLSVSFFPVRSCKP